MEKINQKKLQVLSIFLFSFLLVNATFVFAEALESSHTVIWDTDPEIRENIWKSADESTKKSMLNSFQGESDSSRRIERFQELWEIQKTDGERVELFNLMDEDQKNTLIRAFNSDRAGQGLTDLTKAIQNSGGNEVSKLNRELIGSIIKGSGSDLESRKENYKDIADLFGSEEFKDKRDQFYKDAIDELKDEKYGDLAARESSINSFLEVHDEEKYLESRHSALKAFYGEKTGDYEWKKGNLRYALSSGEMPEQIVATDDNGKKHFIPEKLPEDIDRFSLKSNNNDDQPLVRYYKSGDTGTGMILTGEGKTISSSSDGETSVQFVNEGKDVDGNPAYSIEDSKKYRVKFDTSNKNTDPALQDQAKFTDKYQGWQKGNGYAVLEDNNREFKLTKGRAKTPDGRYYSSGGFSDDGTHLTNVEGNLEDVSTKNKFRLFNDNQKNNKVEGGLHVGGPRETASVYIGEKLSKAPQLNKPTAGSNSPLSFHDTVAVNTYPAAAESTQNVIIDNPDVPETPGVTLGDPSTNPGGGTPNNANEGTGAPVKETPTSTRTAVDIYGATDSVESFEMNNGDTFNLRNGVFSNGAEITEISIGDGNNREILKAISNGKELTQTQVNRLLQGTHTSPDGTKRVGDGANPNERINPGAKIDANPESKGLDIKGPTTPSWIKGSDGSQTNANTPGQPSTNSKVISQELAAFQQSSNWKETLNYLDGRIKDNPIIQEAANFLKDPNAEGTLYMYSADWCGPCRKFKPQIAEYKKLSGRNVEIIPFTSPNGLKSYTGLPHFEVR